MDKITYITDVFLIQMKNELNDSDMIKTAIDKSTSMIHIGEFINSIEYKLEELLPIDIMWNSFNKKIPIYITDELVKIFGYKGILREQKKSILYLIKKYNIEIITFDNAQYEKFLRGNIPPQNSENNIPVNDEHNEKILDIIKYFPKKDIKKCKSTMKHHLIMPRQLKKLMMVVNTDNGNAVREYMLSLDELFQLYMEYQKEYEKNIRMIVEKSNQLLHKKMDKLLGINTEMKDTLEDVQERLTESNDERAPRTQSTMTRDRFILIKLNDPTINWDYYAIRAKSSSLNLKKREILATYTNASQILKFDYSPNAGNLYNLIKEKLRKREQKIRCNKNYIQLINGFTQPQFISAVKQIELSRRMDE